MINEKIYILKQKDFITAILNLNFLLELKMIFDNVSYQQATLLDLLLTKIKFL